MTDKRPMFRDLGLSYEEAGHGIQTAILYRMRREGVEDCNNTSFAGPKHLRVGVNLRAADAAGLARLLMDKGTFTEEEYIEYTRLAVNEELAQEEDALGVTFR